MAESIIIISSLSELDKSMIRYLFKLKAISLENLEEVVGTYSVSMKIIDTANEVIDFMNEFSRKDSIFYIFLGDVREENLKLVCKTTMDITDKTKYFAIKIHVNWLDFSVEQLSFSSKMLTKVR